MSKEDKELLLKDLCARLPYGVILNVTLMDKYDEIVNRDIELTEYNIGYIKKGSHWAEYKPYLCPMSSMTDEEIECMEELSYFKCTLGHAIDKIDFCLKHHLDYRGLIEKGLALEAPEGMYKTE